MPRDSTHFAPFELMYSRTVRGPLHILRELWTQEIDEQEVKSSYQYVLDLRERLHDTLKLAKEQFESSQTSQKKYFDKARRFSPGDKVLALLPTDTNKLLVQWKGPYDIINTVGPNDCKVDINGKEMTMHAISSRNISQDMKKLIQECLRSRARREMISTSRRVWPWLRTTRQIMDTIKTIRPVMNKPPKIYPRLVLGAEGRCFGCQVR